MNRSDKPLVSLIIPNYNGAAFSEQLVADLQSQTYKNIEIILIDDGSTDNSSERFLAMKDQFNNLQVVLSSNEGLGPTRNKGVNLSKGKYIYFLDQDDYIFDTTLETLVDIAEKCQADIITFDSANVREESSNYSKYGEIPNSMRLTDLYSNHHIPQYQILSGREFIYSSLESGQGLFPPIWLHFYRADFLKQSHVKFDPIIHEDNSFTMEILFEAERVFYIPEYLHERRMVSTSMTHCRKTDQHVQGALFCLEKSLKIYRERPMNQHEKRLWKNWNSLNWGMVFDELSKSDRQIQKRYKKNLKKITKNNIDALPLKTVLKGLLF